MPRETKSKGQKDPLDRFYTPKETVKQCLGLLDLSQYDCIIEPSAGTGSFLKELPKGAFGFDIAPAGDGIEEVDWLKLDKTQFKKFNSILVCGNPPFGQQNTLAISFFNESAKFCDTIAFILPLTFKKDSIQNKLDFSFHLEKEIILSNKSFYLNGFETIEVPCVFQVWVKKNEKRKPVRLKTTTNLFSFVDKEYADFRIQRVGGNAGKASFDLNRAVTSNYFIKNNSNKTNEEFVEFINSLKFPTIEFTVGPKSLPKGEMISVIEENWID